MFENRYTKENEEAKIPLFSKLIEAGISPHDGTQLVYKYLSIETAKKVLLNSSFRFSTPGRFNDPFELNTGFVNYKVSREELLDRLLRNIPADEITTAHKKYIESLSTEELIKSYYDGLEIFRRSTLILCASRINSSTLMWSHYADSHKGVCIGFYIPIMDSQKKLITMNVHYANEITPLNLIGGSDFDRYIEFLKWINIKSHVWEYENEVRCCIPNFEPKLSLSTQEYFDFPFPQNSFEEIIFGAGSSSDDILEIKNILHEKNYQIKRSGKMGISKLTFDLEYSDL